MRNRLFVALFALALGLLAPMVPAALAQDEEESGGWSPPTAAVVPLTDATGAVVGHAAVGVDDETGQVMLMVMATGLTPGDHGIHLHTTGNCDPAGEKPYAAAGGHFNPGGGVHGAHAGDLMNLTAGDDGGSFFIYNFGPDTVTVDAGAMGLADADGTALVIHADPDDGVTDPAGNSGTRIACAVLFAPTAA